jgi:hypothetical protein
MFPVPGVAERAAWPVIEAGNRIDDVMLNHPLERDGRGHGHHHRQLTGVARAVHLTVSDREYTLEIDPRESLLDILCERLDLTGTKKGWLRSGRLRRAR